MVSNRCHTATFPSFQPIKGTRFDGGDQGIESFIEGVEGRIHSGAGGAPSSMPLLYSKPRSMTSWFVNNIRETDHLPPKPIPTKILSSLPFPALLPALFKSVSPAGGVKAGRRPPAGGGRGGGGRRGGEGGVRERGEGEGGGGGGEGGRGRGRGGGGGGGGGGEGRGGGEEGGGEGGGGRGEGGGGEKEGGEGERGGGGGEGGEEGG